MRKKIMLSLAVTTLLMTNVSAGNTENDTTVKELSGAVLGKEGRVLISRITMKNGINIPSSLLSYIRETITFPNKVSFESFTFTEKIPLKHTDGEWVKYFSIMKVKDKVSGKILAIPQAFFVNEEDGLVTSHLANYEKRVDYTNATIKLTEDKYIRDKVHTLSGSKKSKHKVVIFSDPMCPVCKKEVPHIIAELKKYPSIFEVLTYSYPLSMHPASDIIERIRIASIMFNKKPEKVSEHFYDMASKVSPQETRALVIIRKFNEVIGEDTGITVQDLNSQKVMSVIKKDIDTGRSLSISGTPSIYFDGNLDIHRDKYRAIIEKLPPEIKSSGAKADVKKPTVWKASKINEKVDVKIKNIRIQGDKQ